MRVKSETRKDPQGLEYQVEFSDGYIVTKLEICIACQFVYRTWSENEN